MRFRTFCNQCAKLNSAIDFDATVLISENDLYEYKCKFGHANLIELQIFKFEILFESGLCAIRDKYFMESILSITASLERFYEFFIKIILKEQGISESLIDTCFKTMSKLSERQFGAFTVLYFSTFKKPPIPLKQKMVEFRNNVVHKGYLPTENETVEYAEGIYFLIKSLYLELLEDYSTPITNYQLDIKRDRRNKYRDLIKKTNVPIVGIAPNLALTHILTIQGFKERTFEESYETVFKNNLYI